MRNDFGAWQVYDWYDGPLEFSFWAHGQQWMGRLFDAHFGPQGRMIYLITPVSEDVLNSFLSNQVDIRQFYESQVQLMLTEFEEGWFLNLTNASKLEVSCGLPDSGLFLDWDGKYLHSSSF